LIPIEKRSPVTIVREAPPEGYSFLRIFPLRISKTVSFTVYFDSGTALGFRAVRCGPCSPGHRALLCAGLLSPWCRACEAGPSLPRSRRGRQVRPGHCSPPRRFVLNTNPSAPRSGLRLNLLLPGACSTTRWFASAVEHKEKYLILRLETALRPSA